MISVSKLSAFEPEETQGTDKNSLEVPTSSFFTPKITSVLVGS